MKVLTTTSYKKFHLLPMNREIISSHAEKMAKSILAMGIIRPVVCCETNCLEGINKLYVLDGQHLLTGLERLKKAVPYIKISVKNELDIVMKMGLLNSSSKSWNLIDYVNAYKMYIPDYMQLFKLKNLYNIDITMLAVIGSLNPKYDSGTGVAPLKSGDFKMINSNAENTCKEFTDLVDLLDNPDRSIKRKFLRAFMHSVGTYDKSQVVKNIAKHKHELNLMGNENSTMQFIQTNIFEVK